MTLVARTVDGMCVTGLLHLMSKYTRSRAELGFFEQRLKCRRVHEGSKIAIALLVDPAGTIPHLFFDHGDPPPVEKGKTCSATGRFRLIPLPVMEETPGYWPPNDRNAWLKSVRTD